MKKYYIVICLSVGGLGNKIFKSGDSVTDANFPPGNAEKLVAEGFLKVDEEKNALELEKSKNKLVAVSSDVLTAEDEAALKAAEEKLAADLLASKDAAEGDGNDEVNNGDEKSLLEQAKDAAEGDVNDEVVAPIKSFDDLTKGEMKAYLDFKDIQYNPHSNKEELYKIWVANQ